MGKASVRRGVRRPPYDRQGKQERKLARNTPVLLPPLAQDATEESASTVVLVCLVCLVYLVHLVLVRRLAGLTNKTDEIDQTNQLRFASKPWLLSCECEGARLDNEPDASHDWKDKPPRVRKCLWPLLFVAKREVYFQICSTVADKALARVRIAASSQMATFSRSFVIAISDLL